MITVISVLGVAAGRDGAGDRAGRDQRLPQHAAAQSAGRDGAHQRDSAKQPGDGIENWPDLVARLRKVPHVTAVSPALYSPTFLHGADPIEGRVLKGIDVDAELALSDTLRHLKAGSLDRLRDPNASPPGIILGSRLARRRRHEGQRQYRRAGPTEMLTPLGLRPVDAALQGVRASSRAASTRSTTTGPTRRSAPRRRRSPWTRSTRSSSTWTISTRRGQIAPEVEKVAGPRYTTTTWMERNKQILGALQHGAPGDHHRDRPDRTGGRAEYLHHAGDDGDGEVPRHRGADVDGRAASRRSAASSCCRAC